MGQRKYTIFSIDNMSEPHTLAKFLRYMDGLSAVGKIKENVTLLVGSYKGELELSFCLSESEFKTYVVPFDWVDRQLSVIRFHKEKGQLPAKLLCLIDPRVILGEGRLVEKTKLEAQLNEEGWTCRLSDNKYWVMEYVTNE